MTVVCHLIQIKTSIPSLSLVSLKKLLLVNVSGYTGVVNINFFCLRHLNE